MSDPARMIDSIIDPGRRGLRPVGMATFFRGIPGLAQRFRDVPAEYVEHERTSGDEVVAISCPCGHRPRLALGESVQCECERVFVNFAAHVMVANSPAPAP